MDLHHGNGDLRDHFYFGGLTLISGVSAVIFRLVAVFALRRMAKADPIMSRVWLRHIRQQDFYAARSGRWREGGFRC